MGGSQGTEDLQRMGTVFYIEPAWIEDKWYYIPFNK